MMRKVLATLAILAICSTAMAKDLSRLDSSLMLGGPIAAGGTRTVNYATGFEAGDGWVDGTPIEMAPNPGPWLESGANLPWASVSSANPAGGAQHMRQINDPTQGAGVLRLTASPDANPTDALKTSSTSIDVYISASNGADYDQGVGFLTPTGSLAFTTRVKMYFYDYDGDGDAGEVLVATDPDGPGAGGPVFVFAEGPGGPGDFLEYPEAAYFNLRMDVDSVNATASYFINGVDIFGGPLNLPFAFLSPVPAEGQHLLVDRFYTLHDNYQFGDWADYDNLNMVPEPGSLALVVLGAVAALRRRR